MKGTEMKGLTINLMLSICGLFTIVYASALLLPVFICKYFIIKLMSNNIFCLAISLNLLVFDFVIFLISASVCSGLAAKVFNLKYSGRHPLDLRNRDVKKWLLSLVIYLPTAVVLDFFHLYPLKSLHIKLFGGKVGKGVIVGGLITDPALLSIGDYSIVGGFSTILGHAVEYGRIQFDMVQIGKHCGVGTRSTILPGAVMEDKAMLAAQSFLPKNHTIPAGKTYGGVPARLWPK